MTPAKNARVPAMSHDEAVRQLSAPSTWCQAARALVTGGDRRALIPLLEAYETPVEGGKRCLLDAMKALGATEAASGLFETQDPRQRIQALRLMELFGSDKHLPLLVRALSDREGGVRAQARQAITNQEWTNSWEVAMIQVLDSKDPETQKMAVEALRRRNSAASNAALQSHGFRDKT